MTEYRYETLESRRCRFATVELLSMRPIGRRGVVTLYAAGVMCGGERVIVAQRLRAMPEAARVCEGLEAVVELVTRASTNYGAEQLARLAADLRVPS